MEAGVLIGIHGRKNEWVFGLSLLLFVFLDAPNLHVRLSMIENLLILLH